MPFQSQAQQRFAFGTDQPWAKQWAAETDFARLPKRKRRARHKAAPPTLADLEAYVSSPAYTPDGAQALAAQIPMLREKATGAPGEHIAPGITRIHGNLCNVHGKYGPCDKALSGKKKPLKGRKPAKPRKVPQTPAERAQARDTQHQANIASVAQQMANSDTGLSPSGVKALTAFAKGQQPDATQGPGLAKMGLAEQASDGSYRMTPTGHAVVSAMQAGDYQHAVDAVSRGTDASGRRAERVTAHQARTQATAARHAAAQAKQDARLAKQGKKPRAKKPTTTTTTTPAGAAHHAPTSHRPITIGAGASVHAPKLAPAPKAPASTPAKAPAKQLAPALTEAAGKLSDGTASDEQVQALVRNGLAKLDKNGDPVLTAAGLRATQKGLKEVDQGQNHNPQYASQYKAQDNRAIEKHLVVSHSHSIPPSFTVFKDARGQYRWVAFSSTAYRDRDGEIVSTKALADDCARADADGRYGVLDWWHMPSIVLGDCDFNAMHGRVLIESGTFRSQQIAEKVARSAPDLELSIAFLHPHTEPDAHGVFHSIQRFARGLTPRGKASNLFTSFHVKESPMDETKKAALKALGFSDSDIGDMEVRASQTQKAADAQGVAFKADDPEPTEPPDLVINGVTYKAFPPKAAADAAPVEGSPAEEAAETPAEEAMEPDAGMDDAGGLTLSPEDIDAIGQAVGGAITQAIAPLMGLLDIEKKMQGHVQTMMQPFQAQQATKDASDAEKAEQIAALQTALKSTQDKLDELLGIQPAALPQTAANQRASASTDSLIGPDNPLFATIKQAQQAAAAPTFQLPSGANDFVDDKGVSISNLLLGLARAGG